MSTKKSFHYIVGFICALFLLLPQSTNAQVIEEFEPIDASIITNVMRGLTDATLKLNSGVYDMADQLRFNANTNLILEGSGSGFGPEATILDFSTFSEIGDGRALSIRGGVIFVTSLS